MIFVTVGHQMPFDRLVRCVDAWAGRHPERRVLAQIGRSSVVPRHLEWVSTLAPADYEAKLGAATHVVAHAGMGTILTCLAMSKPLLVMPRRAALRETRNDHQLATARVLSRQPGIYVADDEAKLTTALEHLDLIASGGCASPHASNGLLTAIQGFLALEQRARG